MNNQTSHYFKGKKAAANFVADVLKKYSNTKAEMETKNTRMGVLVKVTISGWTDEQLKKIIG